MNILIISDMHIGSNGNFNNFGWNSEKFIGKIEKIKTKYNIHKVILNGDVFDLYQYSFKDIQENNSYITDYLLKGDYIYIRGNHDILNDFALDNYTITNNKGKRIYIEHGHSADYLNGTSLGRFFSRLCYKMLKYISGNKNVMKIYNNIIEKNNSINRIPKKYNSIKYLTYALRLLKTYDIVVLGHTHKIETHHTYILNKKKRYLNCGTCSLGRFQGIVIDTETLKYETIKIPSKKEINKTKQADKKIHQEIETKAMVETF